MAGIVFAKFTKPTMRAETILFSKNALISLRNGSYYLVCRIGDLRYDKVVCVTVLFISICYAYGGGERCQCFKMNNFWAMLHYAVKLKSGQFRRVV